MEKRLKSNFKLLREFSAWTFNITLIYDLNRDFYLSSTSLIDEEISPPSLPPLPLNNYSISHTFSLLPFPSSFSFFFFFQMQLIHHKSTAIRSKFSSNLNSVLKLCLEIPHVCFGGFFPDDFIAQQTFRLWSFITIQHIKRSRGGEIREGCTTVHSRVKNAVLFD